MTDVEPIPAAIVQVLKRIARHFPGVEYDALDPNRDAIELGATRLGLSLHPSVEITPRTIRGHTGQDVDTRSAPYVSAAVHTLRCSGAGDGHVDPDRDDDAFAHQLVALLAADGYRIVRAG